MVTRILVTGSINYDEIAVVDHLPDEHEKVTAKTYYSGLGGSAANTATWLAESTALSVSVVGIVGADQPGQQCVEQLERSGVITDAVIRVPSWPTPKAWCWTDGPHKWIVTSRGSSEPSIPEHTAVGLMDGIRHIHVSSRLDPRLSGILLGTYKTTATVSVELNGKDMAELRAIADLVFMNSRELRSVFGIDVEQLDAETIRRIAPKRGSALVITDGTHKALSADKEHTYVLPVAPVEGIVDRTGAGDAFNAGYLLSWLAGADSPACLEQGLVTSARVLTQLGGSRRL